jgi:hypothetical protein
MGDIGIIIVLFLFIAFLIVESISRYKDQQWRDDLRKKHGLPLTKPTDIWGIEKD